MGKSYDAKLTSKGQVTIPVAIRNALKLDVGSRISFEIEDDGRILINKKEDVLLERILFMIDKFKNDGTFFIIHGSDEESRRQLLLEIIGSEYKKKYAITDRKDHNLPSDFSIKDINFLNSISWSNDFEEDEEYSCEKAIVFSECIPYSLFLGSISKGDDIFLTIDEFKVQDLLKGIEEDIEETEYSLWYLSLNNVFEIGLDIGGMHTLTYYSLSHGNIGKMQQLY